MHTQIHHRVLTGASSCSSHDDIRTGERKNVAVNRVQQQRTTMKKRVFANRNMRNNLAQVPFDMGVTVITAGCSILLVGMWLGATFAEFEGSRYLSLKEDEERKNSSPMPFNELYKIPGSHPRVGDRSKRYVLLRKEYDESTEDNSIRSLEFTQSLQKISSIDTFPFESLDGDQVLYDIYNCPENPPQGYPFAWGAMDVLDSWPVNDINPRSVIHQGLCVFDYQKDYDKAMNYRNLELPFVVKNDPEIAKAVERWHAPGYMESMLGGVRHRTEYSENNHFMYSIPLPNDKKRALKARQRLNVPENWEPPTELTRMPYRQWLEHANVTESVGPNDPHWYFRLIGCGLTGNRGTCDKGSSEYLFDELPFFQPEENLYVREPENQKGIHCRFGMDGVIAENHFDAARNTIVVLGGSRRYILSHPDQCAELALYPKGHPSARHSEVDWSDPDLNKFPQFASAKLNEVIMQAGDAMYLPTHWFHYIVSLELNFQCNTRSGVGYEYADAIQKCGFSTD